MKRIISILLACTILSSLAACQGKADVVKNDRLKSDDIKSENTTDTVDTTIFMSESDAESSTDVPIETSLADIGKKIILDYCDKTEIIYNDRF